MKTTRYAAILLYGLSVAACGSDGPQTVPTGDTHHNSTIEVGTIVDVLTIEDRFTNYLGGALLAGLTPVLDDPDGGPYTLFAPTDAAFEQAFVDLGIGDPVALISNQALLNALLRYHIVNGVVWTTDITSPSVTSDTLAGMAVFTHLDGDAVAVNGGAEAGTTGGAHVEKPDLEALNGVVHIIDRVLLPPDLVSALVYATRSGNTDLGELTAALEAGGVASSLRVDLVADDLSALAPLTLLAPVDDGFPDTAPPNLTQILKYHVVPGELPRASLPAHAPTLATATFGLATPTDLPLTVFFDVTGDPMVNGGSAGIGANVVTTDIATLNGVVHIVDRAVTPLDAAELVDLAGLGTFLTALTTSDPIDETPALQLLADTTPIGVLAPSDAAFDVAFPEGLPGPRDLSTHLALHLLAPTDAMPTSENLATSPNASTLFGVTATFDVTATPPDVSLAGGSSANIDVADLGATNGVVHLVDAVLTHSAK